MSTKLPSSEESQFLQAIKAGNLETVKQMIQTNRDLLFAPGSPIIAAPVTIRRLPTTWPISSCSGFGRAASQKLICTGLSTILAKLHMRRQDIVDVRVSVERPSRWWRGSWLTTLR